MAGAVSSTDLSDGYKIVCTANRDESTGGSDERHSHRRLPDHDRPRAVRALLTGATQGIGKATTHGLCPLVDVLLLHGLEPPTEVQRPLDELRRRNPATVVGFELLGHRHVAAALERIQS
jgi:hypothetical protein